MIFSQSVDLTRFALFLIRPRKWQLTLKGLVIDPEMSWFSSTSELQCPKNEFGIIETTNSITNYNNLSDKFEQYCNVIHLNWHQLSQFHITSHLLSWVSGGGTTNSLPYVFSMNLAYPYRWYCAWWDVKHYPINCKIIYAVINGKPWARVSGETTYSLSHIYNTWASHINETMPMER